MIRPKQGRKPQCSVRRYETDGRSISFPSFSYSICLPEPITLASVSHPICRKSPHQTYSFDSFTLDVTRGCLFYGEQDIKLRRKSFEVLTYLVQNNGRLITKSELIEAIWVKTAVTDDSLVQCLKDIRHALRDEAQHIIKTVHGRGYILDTEVVDGDPSPYLSLRRMAPVVRSSLKSPRGIDAALSSRRQRADTGQ